MRTTCKDCGSGLDGASFSYCKACASTRQRERYARIRGEAGHVVIPRAVTLYDRADAIARQGQPGECAVCHEYEEVGLEILCEEVAHDGEMMVKPYSLMCRSCSEALKAVQRHWDRVLKLVHYAREEDKRLAVD